VETAVVDGRHLGCKHCRLAGHCDGIALGTEGLTAPEGNLSMLSLLCQMNSLASGAEAQQPRRTSPPNEHLASEYQTAVP
jgi:hypothetical protein